jgi:transcriptional regulator with GAF, ATPase, and Fis domain
MGFKLALLNKYKRVQEELGIVGHSEQIRELVELIISIAPTNISVLITGESGTGKEVFAKAIHQLSPRKDKSLISVNCGAIPEGIPRRHTGRFSQKRTFRSPKRRVYRGGNHEKGVC